METIKLNWKKGKHPKNLNISFRDCSITDVDADGVITVLTSSGDKPGGLSESIIKRAGYSVLNEIQRGEKPKKVSENLVTEAGALKCQFIIHCVCPKWANYDEGSKSECLKDLCNTVKRALFTACEKRLDSVALPPIGSGFIYGIPNFACSAMYVKAIKEFLDFLPALDHPLKEIKFCDKSKEMVGLVHNAFELSRGKPEVLSEKSVMMQALNISKPHNHSFRGNSPSKSSSTEFKSGQQNYENPYATHQSLPQPSLNGFVPNSKIPSNWVFKNSQGSTATFMVNNLKVLIYQHDIVNLGNVDIIVSTENQQVAGNGKLAKAILQKAGEKYQKEHDKLHTPNKRKWTDVLQTKAGQLNCKIVLHAIIEKFPNVDPSKSHLDMLWETTQNVLKAANEKKGKWFREFQCFSVALPLLGAGSVTNRQYCEKYARAMMQGIESFSTRPNLKLQEIHIVSVTPETTQILVNTCQTFCSIPTYDEKEKKKQPKTRNTKVNKKDPSKFNSSEFRLIDTWRALNQSKQGKTTDSFYEPVPTFGPVSTEKENSAANNKGNLQLIDSESEDDEPSQQRPVTPEQEEEGACAAILNNSTCVICLDDDLTEPVRLKICKHEFCRECISEFLSQKPSCPVCNMVYGEMFGNQPTDGIAKIYKDEAPLPSYECGTLVIQYDFPDGRQTEEHPNPRKPYRGITRQAYLPDNTEGREILQLLKRAFEHRLIFTVGYSRTSGRDNVVTWNDIHHKTRRAGGPEQYGYPDPGFLTRIRDELSAKGISDDQAVINSFWSSV